MYQYLLFDLDGTLTDSRDGILKSIRYALERMGRPCPPYETLLLFIGPPLADSFCRYCDMDAETAHTAVRIFRERYEVKGLFENRPTPGAEQLLRNLKNKGYTIAIASSKPERSVLRIAEYFGFTPWLDAICGSDGNNENKADVIRLALRRLDVDEEERGRVVMIGDRKYDVEGARECGLPCIGVTLVDYAPVGELERAGALTVVRTNAELERYLDETDAELSAQCAAR